MTVVDGGRRMGIFGTLFGHSKPVPIGPERIFAMSTAQIDLETEQNQTPTGTAAMCFKGVASGPFAQIQRDLEELLHISERDDGLTYRSLKDELDYSWLIFTVADFQTLVTTLHMASQTLVDSGYGSQLLFAIFGFKGGDGKVVYWVYNYKRGMFYPFVPQTTSHDTLKRRNNAEELRLATAANKALPMETEIERWYPVWDLPF